MQTDSELLEWAALAADGMVQWENCVPWFVGNDPGVEYEWNPINNDGDALRLAVKLGMNVAFIPASYPNSFCEVAAGFDASGWPNVRSNEPHGSDPYAATRLAIVRAAAEIGRQMEEGGEA